MFDQDLNAPRRRTTRRRWIGSLIALCLFLCAGLWIIVAAATYEPPTHQPSYGPSVFYVKGNALYLNYEVNGRRSFLCLTENLIDAEDPDSIPFVTISFTEDADVAQMGAAARQLRRGLQQSLFSQGCIISDPLCLYMDAYDGEFYDLRCRDFTSVRTTSIALDISSHLADADLEHIVYYRWSSTWYIDCGLFLYDRSSGETVTLWADAVDNYAISSDGGRVVFRTQDGALHCYHTDTGVTESVEDADDPTLTWERSLPSFSEFWQSPEDFYAGDDHYTVADNGLYRNGERCIPNPEQVRCSGDYVACIAGGNLYVLHGEQQTVIATNVLDYDLREDGTVFYIIEYRDGTGDLCYWSDENQQGRKLDSFFIKYLLHS